MKKSTVFKKIGFFAVTLMLVALMVVASVSLVAAGEEYSDVKYSTASVSIDGSIILKFYITDLGSLDDEEGAYLAVRIPDEHGNYSVHKMTADDLIKDGNRHVLAVRLAAAQQTESISVQLIIPGANWSGKVFTYSISKYNNKVLELARDNENANQAAYKEVAIPLKAMLNYGAMAQTEFGYNTDNKANEGVYSNEDKKNPADVVGADHFKDVPGTEKTVVGDVQVAGIQAQYKSEINAFVFIKSPLEKPVVTVKLEYEAAYTVRSKDVIKLDKGLDSDDGWYQVVIRNISAHALDRKMTITAKVNDNNQASLTCSMLNYFENLIVNTPEGVKPESVRTAQALYNFHMAMKSYMGTAPEVEVAECSHKDADGNLINYYIEVLAPATCQHAGRQIKVCSLCDEQIEGTEEQIAKAAHKYSTVVDTLPTCTAEGTQHKKCDNCDATMAMANIPMLDHSFEDEAEVVTEATCTTEGLMTAKCKFCGTASEEQIVIPAFEHDFDYANSEITAEPGCTTAGERTYYCNNEGCNATKVEAVVALGHTYGAEGRTEPTCDTPGSINTTCTVCGEGVEKAIPATGHKYSKATCDTPATCTVCQATKGEALGHKTTKATCTAPEVCYVCKKVITEASGQDHDWGEGVIGAGKITYTCNECNATKAEPIVSFAIDPVYAVAGENVVLTVRLINNPGIWATRFEIPVNTNVFEFVGASGSMFDAYECGLEGNKIVYFAYNNAVANVYDEIVVQITLKTKADIHENSQGSYQFKALPTEGNTTNVDKQVIENIQSTSTTITIKGHNPETVPGKAMTCAEDGLTDGIVCKDCGAVIKAQEVIVASGHDAPEATCTTESVCKECGVLLSHALGHDRNEFSAVSECSRCGVEADRFVNVIYEKGDLANVSTNGKYTVELTEDGVKFTAAAKDDSNIGFFENKGDVETGKYLFFKYKAEGEIDFQIFTSTAYSKPNGANDGQFKYTLVTDGEWHIAVIDVTYLTANEDDGKYYVKQFRFDVEGTGVYAEFAYVGYSADLANIAKFIGDELGAYCEHKMGTTDTYVDVNGHDSVCNLCGAVLGTHAHVTGIPAAWNAENNRYEYTCTDCNGVATTDWQWSRDFSDYADGTRFSSTGGGAGHSVQGGVLVMTPNGNTTWGGISIGANGATQLGQYYVVKYRVPTDGVANGATTVKANIRFQGGKFADGSNQPGGAYTLTMQADNEWHIAIIDISKIGSLKDHTSNGLVNTPDVDHWFCNYADANLLKYEVAFEGCVETIDRIPDSIFADVECDHVVNDSSKVTELAVYEVIGDGSGQMYYATCNACGEKVKKTITIHGAYWNNPVISDGKTLANGDTVVAGWASVAGGLKEALFTITNVNDPTETTVVVVPVTAVGYGNENWPEKLGAWEDRSYITISFSVDDWSDVNGVDFNGDEVTISLAVVLRKDPTAAPISHRICNTAGKNSVTVQIKYHEHVAGAPEEGNRVEPTCSTAGSYTSTVSCEECGAIISQETVVIPATGKHTPDVYSTWDAEAKAFKGTCTSCGAKATAWANVVFDKSDLMKVTSGLTKSETATGVKFTNPDAADRNFTLFEKMTGIETGKYLFIKYKAGGTGSGTGIFTATDEAGPIWNRNTSITLNNDGEWHVIFIDISKLHTFPAAEDGKYYAQHFRMDVEGSVGAWMEIEYIGFTSNVAVTVAAINAGDATAKNYCDCSSAAAVATYIDKDTHAPVCALCGKAAATEAHSGATSSTWNDALGYYETNTACTVCGEKYCYGNANLYLEAENKSNIGEGAWNTAQSTHGDYIALWSKNAAGSWSEARFNINADFAITGQYFVFRYMVPGTLSNHNLVLLTQAGTSGRGNKVTIPLTVDGEWHIAIVDLSSAGFNASSIFSPDSRFSLDSWGVDEKVYFDWFRMYDSAARIPDEYKPKCDHANVKTNVDMGDGTHADVCSDCYAVVGDPVAHTAGDASKENINKATCVADGSYDMVVRCSVCNGEVSRETHVAPATGIHTGANSATWDAEKQQYVSKDPCKVCGQYYNLYFNVLTTSDNTKGLNGTSPFQFGVSDATSDSYMHFWFDKGTTGDVWKPSAINCNPDEAVTGQYVVVKYRVPAEYANGYRLEIQTVPAANVSGNNRGAFVNYGGFIADNEWHIIIVDLTVLGTTYFPANADGTYTAAPTFWVQPSYSRLVSGEMDIEYIAFTDDLDRMFAGLAAYDADITPTSGVCPCPASAIKPVADKCQTVCVICGKVAQTFGDTHTNVEVEAVQPDCINAGSTAGIMCTDCGYVTSAPETIPSTGVHAGGSDGEYCKGCKQFLKADPATYFNKFIGGADMTYSSSLGNNWSANGYRVYTKATDGGELYIKPSFDGSVTGQFMVIKYKATGTINVQFYQSTVQAGEHADYCFRHYPDVYGEWQYYIVDLTKVLPEAAMKAVDGTYSIKGLRWDVEGQGTLEVAYLAYTDSLEKAISGVLAIDGFDSYPASRCTHTASTTALTTYEIVGNGSGQEYRATCNLCGAKCGKATISLKLQAPDNIPNGGDTVNPVPADFLRGWVVMTGGVGKVELVVTDVETGEVAIVTVQATYDGSLQNNSYVLSGGYEVTGVPSTYRYTFKNVFDFSKLETTDGTVHDFSGGQVTIAANFYSLADPTAPAIKTDAWKRTINVHRHTAGEVVELSRTEATCQAAGSYVTATVCTECGGNYDQTTHEIPVTGHVGGSNNEYCRYCYTFVNTADISKYFTYFWGGKNAPNAGLNASYMGQDSETGYNVYTTTQTDYRHQLIATDSPSIAGRYLVVKYLLVRGEMTLGTFPTTRQSSINGSYTYNHRLEAGGWKYLVIDLKAGTSNGGVQADDNGDVYLKHFSVDYDLADGTTATAEFAYMALATTLENAIAGIKAIEGTETVPQAYCLHTAGTNDLSVYEVIGDGSGQMYTGTCKACGAKSGIKTITPYKNWWDTEIESGKTYANGDLVIGGWVSVAGGWQDAIFTITNVNDPTETTQVVVPVTTKGYDDPGGSWPSILGPAAERRKIEVYLTVEDWSDVNGFNFSGDDVTISLALVLNKDPEAAPIPYKVNRAGAMSVTINIESNCPVDTLWDKKAFATKMGWDSAELTETSAKFVGTVKGSADNLGAGNVISIIDGEKVYENSNYFFIKYKASAGTTIDVYLNALDDGTGGWNLISNASGLFIADNEWHVLVYDCLGSQADVFKIYFNTTSADSEAPVIEIAYAGFAKTEGQIMELLDAEKDTKLVMSQLWDQDELMSVKLNSFDTRVETEDGVKFTGTNGTAWSHNQIVFMEDGKAENGDPAYLEGVNCFVIKYRVAEGTECNMALDYPISQWTQMDELVIADGEWHVLAFHLSYPNPYTCKVYFNAVEGTPEIEIAYAGFALIPSAD